MTAGPLLPPPRVVRDPFALVGTTVAQKYAIESVIGEGGYGVVYSARHLLIGKPVAVKCMKPLGTSAEDAARATALFLREAQVLFSMSHPGIVRLYDVGTLTLAFAEVPYAVLELVEGRSLEQDIDTRAREGRPYTRDELHHLFRGVLEALAFTHDAGIAHRDLKPSNIMLVAGPGPGFTTKVLDFGVARFVATNTKHSTGITGFTPAYAAPEQWTEGLGDPGPATDVFSVALTLAEACTLKTVIDARTPAQIFGIVMATGRKVDVAARPDLPKCLQLVIDRALQVQQSGRYANAREMLADVESAFANDTVAAATMPASAPPTLGALVKHDRTAPFPMWPEAGPRVPSGLTGPLVPNAAGFAQHVTLGSARPPDPNHATAPGADAVRSPEVPPLVHPNQRARSPVGWVIALAVASIVMLGGGVFAGRRMGARAPVEAPRPVVASAAPAAAKRPVLSVVALATGSQFTPNQILTSVEDTREELLKCHTTAVASGAPAITDVTLFVTIHPTGFVWNVLDLEVIDPIAGKYDRFEHLCLTGVASALRFPTHDREDLTGAVIKLRFRPDVPDDSPVAEGTSAVYASSWIKDSPKAVYPAYDVSMHTHGRIVTYDYKDGVGVCLAYNERLRCRWVQIDSNGRATFERKEDGALYEGRWGLGEDDKAEGTWTMKLRPVATKKKAK